MIGRLVDIAEPSRHVSVSRGHLVVSGPEGVVGTVPLDDLAAVMATAPDMGCTKAAMVALAERGVPLVIAGSQFRPVGVLWPLDAHHAQSGRLDAQAALSQPRRKQLWAHIVRAKVLQQAAVLAVRGASPLALRAMVRKVRSGDVGNVEAQAARAYWPALFGDGFRRRRDGDGANILLNYGYAVLRSASARAVAAAGLHPGLGLHHANKLNPMRLADDLMEPFRPIVDWQVLQLLDRGMTELDAPARRGLASILSLDLRGERGTSPLMECLWQVAASLARVCTRERISLFLPPTWSPPRDGHAAAA